MKVSQLLSELQGNILRDTSHAVRGQGSSQWNLASLVAYLSEAADIMAEETHCIVDSSTPEITEITLVTGEDVYDLSDRIIDVKSVRVGYRRTGRRLRQVTTHEMEDGSEDITTAYPTKLYSRPGEPFAFALDEASNQLRIYPTPRTEDEGVVVYLRVSRLPLNPLPVPVDNDPDSDVEPEVPVQRHLDLCEWAAYRALRNHDTDVENIPKATTHRNQWDRTISKMRKRWRRKHLLPATFGVRVNN